MTFQDWLRANQPLLAAAVLPESFAVVRDGMALAWDAAIVAALEQVPGGDTCRPADVADAIRSLTEEPLQPFHSSEKP